VFASVNSIGFTSLIKSSTGIETPEFSEDKPMSGFYFHDSVSKSGHVLHGTLKFTHDSLVSQWIRKQSDSLRLEKSNINELEFLVQEIEAEVLLLEKQKQANTILFVLLFCVFVVSFFFRKKIRLFKSQLLNKKKKEVLKTQSVNNKNTLNISTDTVEVLSHLLDKFEKELGFLDPNMTLNLLSKKMQTNSTYLSKVVNNTKGVNFSGYLNDLRISYIIEQLKLNPKLMHYTSKALSEEAGYKTRESFTKAFYKKMGEYPKAYISKPQSVDL